MSPAFVFATLRLIFYDYLSKSRREQKERLKNYKKKIENRPT